MSEPGTASPPPNIGSSAVVSAVLLRVGEVASKETREVQSATCVWEYFSECDEPDTFGIQGEKELAEIKIFGKLRGKCRRKARVAN